MPSLRDIIRDELGVREVNGTDEWPCKCFSPEHDDQRPSASINVVKGLWVCYSCGRGGSVESLLSGAPISDPKVTELLERTDTNLDWHTDKNHYSESWLRIFRGSESSHHQYWLERGFDDAVIQQFSLGYDYDSLCVVYPIRDVDGSILGVVRRRLDGGVPKYRYPKGITKSDLLFRYHEAQYGAVVALVEGALDAIALSQAGVFALGIYGSSLSESQQHLIIRLNPSIIICAFDNDEAGRNVTRQVVESTDLGLISVLKQVNWQQYPLFKDVADLSIEQRKKIIDEAVDCS